MDGLDWKDIMINKYEDRASRPFEILVPKKIIYSAAKYWKKVLFDFEPDDIYKKDIEEYIRQYKIDSNDLSWEHLYNLCVQDNDCESIELLELSNGTLVDIGMNS